MKITISNLNTRLVPDVAALWHQGWIDGHADVVPDELRQLRTLESFQIRTQDNLEVCRVALQGDVLLGFTIVKEDELYQMYASAAARGRGVAQQLIADAEAQISAKGHARARLDCAVGNERAARFYEKSGWVNMGVQTVDLDTLGAPFPLPIWRFEKLLRA